MLAEDRACWKTDAVTLSRMARVCWEATGQGMASREIHKMLLR